MAKKNEALVPEVVETSLAVRENQALAVADGAVSGDRRGKENLNLERLVLPRVAAAQKTSPEIDQTSDRYIEGLRMFEMFNSLTQEQYGNGPLKFAVVRSLPFKAMQFDGNQNVVDFDVKQGDPRLDFTTNEKGERVKPLATEFKEYLVILEDGSVAALSFKSTQIKVSAKLDSFIQFRVGAAWMGMYQITSRGKTFPGGAATQFNILPAGKTPPEIVKAAEELYANTGDVVVDVQRDASGDDFVDANGAEKF